MENLTKNSVSPAKMEVVYNTMGQEIRLNANIVRNYLTKGNGKVSDQEILQFISICKYQQLNPFLNEAYLVKFANNRGGDDTAQIIVSKEAFMKRAEGCEQYRGFKAGLILKRGTECVYEEGEFMRDGDVLLGGWAEVHRSDRDFPIKSFVNLKDYDKGRSTWNAIKCTMIRKVALMHALREAFPAQLGAMYTSDESIKTNIEDAQFVDVEHEISDNANSIELTEEASTTPEQQKSNKEQQLEMPSVFDEI